jgi:hypothetical protein
MSYRCPQPTANSGRERRKAPVDRRFQAIRPTGLGRTGEDPRSQDEGRALTASQSISGIQLGCTC